VLRSIVGCALATLAVSACSTAVSGHGHGTPLASAPTLLPSFSPVAAAPSTSVSVAPRSTHPAPRRVPTAVTSRLPLSYSTGTATRVITVVAASATTTTATVQAWQKSASGWLRVGPAIPGHVGSDGLSAHPSESRSATPIGSFTLTEAFGRDPDPGTALPYRQTTPDDWWISQPGALYNTWQHCAAQCPFVQGAPNEHLYYEVPFYDVAVVIDYNTANSPTGIRQGAGSAFFLHVTDGSATAGCVAIPQSNLVTILRWLTPAAHPRILIGVG
jgi:L,D-peptidoglycan transpeptidase YkuD (ErfK/YbiS/YcfS/YnhG family)